MIDPGLKNKVAIVTGANHGIGAAIAISFARQGAKVMITYLRQSLELYGVTKEEAEGATVPGRAYYCKMISQSAEKVISKIKELGGECYAWKADLSEPNTIPELFDVAEKKLGEVDIVVNNAAFDNPDTFIPEEELTKNPLFADEYRMHSITSDSHDQHFTVNSRAVSLMMAEFAKRHIKCKSKWG